MRGVSPVRREEEARLYMEIAQSEQPSEGELYLLAELQRRMRAFKDTWFKDESHKTKPARPAYFVAELDPATIPPLEEVMDAMERAGWAFRITSRMMDGHRIYSARAWRGEEDTGGSRPCRDPFPRVALAGAWVEMERIYRKRQNDLALQVPAQPINMPLQQAVGQ